jgi:hypothetical protein
MRSRRGVVAAAVLTLATATGCSPSDEAGIAPPPSCTEIERLGLLAQSVPSSSYVPCIADLAAGWQGRALTVQDGAAGFELVSDRAPGRAVRVEFRRRCRMPAAAPIPPRTTGGRSYLALRTIAPRYSGSMYDVFPGGCVKYSFDFERGPHIALMAQLQAAVAFVSRTELARDLHQRLGVELGP